jgi:penicillin-binding protein 2
LASSGLRAPSHRFLPPDPRAAEPYRLTPQLALRIGILGALTLALFALLFLRLWSLQILSGARYVDAAQNNQLRTIRLDAPRGTILDRHGRVLVSNVPGTSVQIWPADLPKRGRYQMLKRLSKVVDVPVAQIAAEIEKRKGDPLTPITVKEAVHEPQVAYLYEHRQEFRGVTITQSFLRDYKYRALGAHILGHVGEISPEQLRRDRSRRHRGGDLVGQSGVEAQYDEYLSGAPGLAQLRVDSLGRPRGQLAPRQQARAGNAIRLTLDVGLQRAAERALTYGIERAWAARRWAADGGAIVAMDPHDGAILAMASNPTYKPSVYVGRPDRRKLAPLLNTRVAEEENFPGLNRAIAGVYPPGSTFKPVTALAAMQEHVISPWSSLPCTPQMTIAKQVFRNWNPYTNRMMNLRDAIAASCDTYFYQLGYEFWLLPKHRGSPLQEWAAKFGFGRPTGIDIGPEHAGLLPTPAWRKATFTQQTDPCCWEIDRLWKPGDSVQLAIGQKDLLVTPLQMARFYAVVANGGRLVTPYLVSGVEQPGSNGRPSVPLRRFTPDTPQATGVDPNALAVVRDGLFAATHFSNGTSSGIFASFPVNIAGKTGTAETLVDGVPRDHSWWCGYGPYESPELVVCAVIENGGHGAEAAAPAALKVFEEFFDVPAGQQDYVLSD